VHANLLKRISTVYFSTRERGGITLDVIADEVSARRYQTDTDSSRAYGTHKVRVRRGVTFHTVGLVVRNRDGDRIDIGALEVIAQPLTRRPL
jgi:hypothetical protein